MKSKNLRIIFMGTPEFAAYSLQTLVENGYNVVAAVTVPDKPAGRGQKITESEVKKYALSQGIPVLQPEKLKNPDFIEQLRGYRADLQIVVAFRMLPEAVWQMPRLGTFNLHGSLLPHYRGAAPLNHAVINGDEETGVTTFMLKHEIDTGNLIFQEKIPVTDSDNAGTIHDKLMVIGANLVLKTADAVAEGNYPQIDQSALIKPGELLKNAPKIFKEDCLINWHQNTKVIFNLIRGLSPYPTAFTYLEEIENGKKIILKIFEVKYIIELHNHQSGAIITDGKSYLNIAAEDGYISILNLQAEGKKKMNIEDFLRGFSIKKYQIKNN